MKATGVVRRIDDLGRIVIPKEIRRNLKINEGDSLEIFVDSSGIILKKYSLLDNMSEISASLVNVARKIYGKNIAITDKERVIAVSKELVTTYKNKELTSNIKDKIEERSEAMIQDSYIIVSDIESVSSCLLIPVIANGDSIGSVILIDDEITEEDKNMVRFVSSILVKNIEQ